MKTFASLLLASVAGVALVVASAPRVQAGGVAVSGFVASPHGFVGFHHVPRRFFRGHPTFVHDRVFFRDRVFFHHPSVFVDIAVPFVLAPYAYYPAPYYYPSRVYSYDPPGRWVPGHYERVWLPDGCAERDVGGAIMRDCSNTGHWEERWVEGHYE